MLPIFQVTKRHEKVLTNNNLTSSSLTCFILSFQGVIENEDKTSGEG